MQLLPLSQRWLTDLGRCGLAGDVALQLHDPLDGGHGLQVDGHNLWGGRRAFFHSREVQPAAEHLRAQGWTKEGAASKRAAGCSSSTHLAPAARGST